MSIITIPARNICERTLSSEGVHAHPKMLTLGIEVLIAKYPEELEETPLCRCLERAALAGCLASSRAAPTGTAHPRIYGWLHQTRHYSNTVIVSVVSLLSRSMHWAGTLELLLEIIPMHSNRGRWAAHVL